MFLKKFFLVFLFFLLSNINLIAKEKTTLIFYTGITMVKPVNELAKKFEKTCNCEIKILQGGSQDLYNSLKISKVGDLYLPGSENYINKNKHEGLLLNSVLVGYNKLALVVKKGNPKNISNSLDELTNPKLKVVLGNEDSGSVGKATKKMLLNYGNYKESILNTIYLAPDSRNLSYSIKQNNADLIVNWYATSFWGNNKKYMEALPIDEKYAKKSKLMLTLLKSSKNKRLAKKFMNLASSKEGIKIFSKYGFYN